MALTSFPTSFTASTSNFCSASLQRLCSPSSVFLCALPFAVSPVSTLAFFPLPLASSLAASFFRFSPFPFPSPLSAFVEAGGSGGGGERTVHLPLLGVEPPLLQQLLAPHETELVALLVLVEEHHAVGCCPVREERGDLAEVLRVLHELLEEDVLLLLVPHQGPLLPFQLTLGVHDEGVVVVEPAPAPLVVVKDHRR